MRINLILNLGARLFDARPLQFNFDQYEIMVGNQADA
jgi:hypothetical protein